MGRSRLAGTVHRVRLPDGRFLGVEEFGDPEGEPAFYFHGGLSSRIDIAFASDTCRELGLRLISVDRPGIGRSSPQAGRSLSDWPMDIAKLADALGLERFALLGWSAGGPYVLACAAAMPHRITKAATVAGMGPLERPGAADELGMLADRWLFPWSRKAPRLVALVLRAMRLTPAWLLRLILLRDLRTSGDADLELVRSLPRGRLAGAFYEALRQGGEGVVQDYRITGRDWGVRLEDLRVPLTFWHGVQDGLVPIEHAHGLAARVLPDPLRAIDGHGHFLAFDRSILVEILRELKR